MSNQIKMVLSSANIEKSTRKKNYLSREETQQLNQILHRVPNRTSATLIPSWHHQALTMEKTMTIVKQMLGLNSAHCQYSKLLVDLVRKVRG